MSKPVNHFYEFDSFQVDAEERVLRRNGVPVPLPPKIFDTLLVLVEQSGHIVDKEELIRKVWPDTFVEENNLSQYISVLRKTLGDERHEQRYIETVPRRGYRFAAGVRESWSENGEVLRATQTKVSLVIKEEEETHEGEEERPLVSAQPRLTVQTSAVEALRGGIQPFRLRKVLVPTLIATAVIVVAVVAWRVSRSPERRLAFGARDWILITNFENRTGESLFDGTIESALERELSNSSFVNVVPRQRIEDTLRLMTKPVETKVDAEVGREVCLRDGGIRAMLTGRTEKFGLMYVLSVSLIDPKVDRTVISTSEEASSQEQIWPAVRRLSSWVRERLGEELSNTQQSDAEVPKLTTTSLRALQLYAQHSAFENRAKPKIKEQLLREALKEDPDFAMAHLMLAYILKWQGKPGEDWQPLAKRALELSERVSERERYRIAGFYYSMTEQTETSVAIAEAYAQRYPDDFEARHTVGNAYWILGRWREAREHIVAAANLRPNDSGTVRWAGQLLLQNGRNRDEARRYLERALELGSEQAVNPGELLWARGFPIFDLWLDSRLDLAFSKFEEFVRATDADSSTNAQRYGAGGSAQFIGNFYLLFGKLRAAEETYQKITDERVRNQFLSYVAFARGDDANLKKYVLKYVRDPSPRPSADSMSLLIRAGLFSEARKLQSTWQNNLDQHLPELSRYNGPYPFVTRGVFSEYLKNLQGEIALSGGNTADGMSHLEDGTQRLRTMGEGIFLAGSESLANAYEQQGDSAGLLRVLEKASAEKLLLYRVRLEPVVIYWQRNQLRLAQLYRKLGRVEEARKVADELLSQLAYADSDHPILRQLNKTMSAWR